MQLSKYSMGVGDRFGRQAKAQLRAILQAKDAGVTVAPVWNKSNREHTIIGTCPQDVRNAVTAAVNAVGFTGEYHVDADHIGLKNVDWFMDSSDFFTLDVADFTGKAAAQEDIQAFLARHQNLIGKRLAIPGLQEPLLVESAEAEAIAGKYLLAVQEAGKLYRHILQAKGEGNFIPEVSMDETDLPQTPRDMLFILAAFADEGIPAQTIAPKFTGRFNKGVDYVGDLKVFDREFNEDLAVIQFAIKEFGLPANLKLSVHSGSDKFSIYPIINKAIHRTGAGLHLKTAGTTWLEELIGLAAADGDGLKLAKEVYAEAYRRRKELSIPYATVIDIHPDCLPTPAEVAQWSSEKFTRTLRHDQSCADYNMHFRQMLHVAFRVAAEMGARYLSALDEFEEVISANVATNIFDRHLKRIFL
ncbi:MAG: hypothetical protein IJJ33_07455 [Victivallales bacterium]|nr:hypothetical protein [Victivallales bacterium]